MATFYLAFNPSSFFSVSNQKRSSSNSIQCCQDTSGQPRPRVTREPPDDWLTSFPEKNPILSSSTVLPPRPRRIILVRHGESEGNVNETVYTRVADPKIKLTETGMAQAEECGKNIRKMIERDYVDDWKVYFYVSPYRRTLETMRCLARAFTRQRIAGWREEPRLREQDFGRYPILTDPISHTCLTKQKCDKNGFN